MTLAALPENGYIFNNQFFGSGARGTLTIETQGIQHHFLKLRDSRTGELKLSFFVRAGETVDMEVPAGVYTLSYASGETWYGIKDLFGEDTYYAKSDDLFPFTVTEESATWWKVELYLNSDGNMDTYTIDADEF